MPGKTSMMLAAQRWTIGPLPVPPATLLDPVGEHAVPGSPPVRSWDVAWGTALGSAVSALEPISRRRGAW